MTYKNISSIISKNSEAFAFKKICLIDTTCELIYVVYSIPTLYSMSPGKKAIKHSSHIRICTQCHHERTEAYSNAKRQTTIQNI